jgi:hypothetical protein
LDDGGEREREKAVGRSFQLSAAVGGRRSRRLCPVSGLES